MHAAKLPDGQDVVIKVKRPNIEKIIKRDIELLYSFAKLLQRYTTFGKRIRAQEIIAEFEQTIINELDLLREATNASILKILINSMYLKFIGNIVVKTSW